MRVEVTLMSWGIFENVSVCVCVSVYGRGFLADLQVMSNQSCGVLVP